MSPQLFQSMTWENRRRMRVCIRCRFLVGFCVDPKLCLSFPISKNGLKYCKYYFCLLQEFSILRKKIYYVPSLKPWEKKKQQFSLTFWVGITPCHTPGSQVMTQRSDTDILLGFLFPLMK